MTTIKTQNRFIKTKIPAPGTNKIIKSLEKSESRSMQGQLPIVWSKAEGHSLFDIAGNKFIDFTSTIFVANIGHSNKNLIKLMRYFTLISLRYAYELSNLLLMTLLKFFKSFLLECPIFVTNIVDVKSINLLFAISKMLKFSAFFQTIGN